MKKALRWKACNANIVKKNQEKTPMDEFFPSGKQKNYETKNECPYLLRSMRNELNFSKLVKL